MYKAGRKSELFYHSFLAVFPSLVMQQISSFILYTGFFFKCLCIAGFLQSGALYATIRPNHPDQSTLRKVLGSTEHLDWLKIDLNVAEIITVQD